MDKLTFEEIYDAYILCLRHKKNKIGTYKFTNENLCTNLIELLDEINERRYEPKPSNCYVVTEPALREIYAAQFGDRVIQHFYMKEVNPILEKELIDGCCSCRTKKGTEYALKKTKEFLTKTSEFGKKDCYFLKIDLSGYFMSIDRKLVGEKFTKLINEKYEGEHKEILLYLTPIIFENNPAINCKYKCNEKLREKVPERRKMKRDSKYGMAIGNLTAQAGSNLNLCEFDKYVTNTLGLKQYVRYVDDIVIVSDDKAKLKAALPLIIKKLEETHQNISLKKTRIDTAYHGVPFLGKVSYPYGYQKAGKQATIRTIQRAKTTKFSDKANLLAKTNSQIGYLKRFNCRKLIQNYVEALPQKVKDVVEYKPTSRKFIIKKEDTNEKFGIKVEENNNI